MRIFSAIAMILVLVTLTGCDSFTKHDAGIVGGAVAGGVAGSYLTGGSAVGTVAGAAGGAYIGHKLTQ